MTIAVRTLPHFAQHIWANLRTELIWAYDRAVFESDRMLYSDLSEGNKAWLIREGEVTITNSSMQSMTVKAGQWIFLPHEHTRHRFSANAKILSIYFLCQWSSGDNLFQGKSGHLINSEAFPQLEKRGHALEKLVRQYQFNTSTGLARIPSDYSSFLKMQALFIQWLSEWYRVMILLDQRIAGFQPSDSRVLEVLRYLNDAPLDSPFPLAKLKNELQLGEAHLNRLFLQQFGMTIRRYWEARRLTFAKTCLEGSSMPVKEIAYRLAFRSDSHFVIWFRRLTGDRPSDYRRKTSVVFA